MKKLPKNILPRKSAIMCPECGHDEVLTSVLGTARREGKHLIIELGGWGDESICLECHNRNYEFDLPEMLLRISQPSGDRSDGQTAPCTVELIVPGYELDDEDEGIGNAYVDRPEQEVSSEVILTPDCCNDCRKIFDLFIARLAERMKVTPCAEDLRNAKEVLVEMQRELKDEQINVHGTLKHLRDELGMMCDGALVENFLGREEANGNEHGRAPYYKPLAKMSSEEGRILGPQWRYEDDGLWDHFVELMFEAFSKDEACNDDFGKTIAILERMNEEWSAGESAQIDIQRTLALMKSMGGCCDCRIAVNVVMKDEMSGRWSSYQVAR